jgi:hypothetical protein
LGIGLTYKIDSTKKKDKKKKEPIEPIKNIEIFPYIQNHKPIDMKSYRKVFEKDEVDESSIYLKSETVLDDFF